MLYYIQVTIEVVEVEDEETTETHLVETHLAQDAVNVVQRTIGPENVQTLPSPVTQTVSNAGKWDTFLENAHKEEEINVLIVEMKDTRRETAQINLK